MADEGVKDAKTENVTVKMLQAVRWNDAGEPGRVLPIGSTQWIPRPTAIDWTLRGLVNPEGWQATQDELREGAAAAFEALEADRTGRGIPADGIWKVPALMRRYSALAALVGGRFVSRPQIDGPEAA